MTNRLEDELRRIIARMDQEEYPSREHDQPGTTEQDGEPEINAEMPPDELQDVYVLIVREQAEAEEGEPAQVVESTLVPPRHPSLLPAYAICGGYLLLLVATLAFQLACLFNPSVATVTLVPKTQHVTMTGTLQLGRLLHPITISQAQTVPTTGTGHQDARAATGTVTFYNGLFTSQTIAAGTIFTGTDGVQVATDETVTLPPNHPPVDGQATVSAHALNTGTQGNMPAGEIEVTISNSVLVRNSAFHGGQDERAFHTVAASDLASTAPELQTAVARSVNEAFVGQLKADEHVFFLPCHPTVVSNHQIGQEATQVTVTVSETCSAVAYSSQEVATQATSLLSTQPQQHVGTGYSLLGPVHISVQQATVTRSAAVMLSFSASGTWVYGLSKPAQARITHLLAGKTTQEAMHLLATLPGVEQAAIRFEGFGDTTRLPKQSSLIHLEFVVM